MPSGIRLRLPSLLASKFRARTSAAAARRAPCGYGAAMLAMVGCGKFKSVQEAADKLVEVASTTEPDAELTAKYEVRYQNFKKLYPALKNFFAANGCERHRPLQS